MNLVNNADRHTETSTSLLREELERCLGILADWEATEKVILFGSLATGEADANSDIDITVIARTEDDFWARNRKVRRLLRPRGAMDIIVYTPAEVEQLRDTRPFFRDEILTKGRVVFEREHESLAGLRP
jgi:predicted nucleotidyltransferase